MAATIVDVAARAGVSTATVSRVLSGAAVARPATRDRVLLAARELDYRPSGIARALKRNETRTLGLVVTDITNPFYPQVVRAIEEVAHARGYALLLADGGDDPGRELELLDRLVERRVDGIVVASSRMRRRHAERLAAASVPVVLVNDSVAVSSLPSVTTAHRRGARMATTHLVELGHRRIGHISAPSDQAASGLRRRGVRDALRGIGEPLVVDGDGGVEGGAACVEPLLAASVTGIVAYNDLTAIGALRGLRQHGVRVPLEVSVVGFDDIEMAAWTDPPLTTIRQPTAALARWAIERLILGLNGETAEAEPIMLNPELVIRASTAPPSVRSGRAQICRARRGGLVRGGE